MAGTNVGAVSCCSHRRKAEAYRALGLFYSKQEHHESAAFHLFHAATAASQSYHERGQQPLHAQHRLYDGEVQDHRKGEEGEDDERIQFVKMRADTEGDVDAMVNMGDLYYYGARGVERDQAQAFQYYHRAAELGHSGAQSGVAVMLLKGEGTPQDSTAALA